MGDKWIDCELGDVIELKRGYDLPKTTRLAGRIPVVSSSGESGFHNESKVTAPGVVTGRYGTIGKVFYLDIDFWPLNTTLYVRDFKGNDPLFIYYFLKTISYSDYTDKAAVPGINRNHIHKAKVKIPEGIDYQKKIAKKLKDLDKKITLNRQINQTLEQMAQVLFKSWFVDFDPVVDNALDAGFFEQDLEFSDELLRRAEVRKAVRKNVDFKPLPEDIRQLFPAAFEKCSEPSLGLGGWMPEGGAVSHLSDFGNIITGKTPSKNIVDAFGDKKEGNHPFITPTDIGSDTHVQTTLRYLTQNGQSVLAKSKIRAGSICVSCIGSQMGKTVFADYDSFTNQQINSILLDNIQDASFVFCFLRLNREVLFKLGSSGSTMPILNKNDFSKIKILNPSKKLISVFDDYTGTLYKKISRNLNLNSALINLRDTLLPKLISGELRLSDSEVDTADEVLA